MWPLILACTPDPAGPRDADGEHTGAPFDPLAFHDAAGPHRAGYRELSVSWTDPLLPAPRELAVALWYPTDAESGLPVAYSGVFPDALALGDAEPVPGPLPLVLFSHGHQGFAGNSSFLMRHLASHGWLVAAPDHTDNTTFDGSERTTEIYWERPLDLVAVLDAVRGEWDTTDELGVVGHSFGGYTVHLSAGGEIAVDDVVPPCLDGTDTSDFCSTMTTAQAERLGGDLALPGLRGAVSMAPGDYGLLGEAGVGAIDVPLLLLTGGLDGGTPGGGDLVWPALTARKAGVHIPTMGHQGFTDFSGTLGDPPGSIDPEEGFHIVRTAVSAWLDATVRGDERGLALFDGTLELSPLAELREP